MVALLFCFRQNPSFEMADIPKETRPNDLLISVRTTPWFPGCRNASSTRTRDHPRKIALRFHAKKCL